MAVTMSFASKLAALMNADPQHVKAFLDQWAPWEGSNASYNPLATTQGSPGSSDFNSVGVKNYTSEDAGVMATYQTLTNGYYPDVVKYMETGSADPAAMAKQIRTWGTTGFANEIEKGALGSGGGGGMQGGYDLGGGSSSGGGGVPTADSINEAADYVATVRAQKPTNGNADDLDQWFARLTAAKQALADEVDKVNQASGDAWKLNADWQTSKFNAALNRANTMLAIDNAGADRANMAVNRQLSGMAEARNRAQFVSDTLQKLAPWANGGKQAFAPSDLGAGVGEFARMIGLDPSQTLIRYPGTASIDPQSLLNEYDQGLGVTGPLPNIPGMSGDYGVPSNSLLDSIGPPPSQVTAGQFAGVGPSAASLLNGAMANMPSQTKTLPNGQVVPDDSFGTDGQRIDKGNGITWYKNPATHSWEVYDNGVKQTGAVASGISPAFSFGRSGGGGGGSLLDRFVPSGGGSW